MKVLLVSAYFPPDSGSAAVLYHELGQALAALGHEVTVLTTLPGYHATGDLRRYRRRLWQRERVRLVDVLRVASPRLPRRFVPGRALWQFGAALAIAVAGLLVRRHDVALVYSPPLPLGMSAWCISRLRGTPFVLNVQDLFPKSAVDLGLLRNRAAIRFFERLEEFLYARSDALAVHSEGNAGFVAGEGARPGRVHLIGNWVDTDAIRADGDGSVLRARLGLAGAFVVSFAGVLGWSQDLDVVLDAASILKDRPEIRWLIVGDGVEKARLERKARDRLLESVIFLPMVPADEYPEVLYASDLGLATLKADVRTPVVPSKILSIMAAGKPVVACIDPAGDAARLIERADCGVALPPEDAASLARAVTGLLGNPELRRRYGRNGRVCAEEYHSLKVAARRFADLFGDLVRPERGAPA